MSCSPAKLEISESIMRLTQKGILDNLNEFYTAIGPKLAGNSQTAAKTELPFQNSKWFDNANPGFIFMEVDSIFIYRQLQFIKTNKATAPVAFPAKFIKFGSESKYRFECKKQNRAIPDENCQIQRTLQKQKQFLDLAYSLK